MLERFAICQFAPYVAYATTRGKWWEQWCHGGGHSALGRIGRGGAIPSAVMPKPITEEGLGIDEFEQYAVQRLKEEA